MSSTPKEATLENIKTIILSGEKIFDNLTNASTLDDIVTLLKPLDATQIDELYKIFEGFKEFDAYANILNTPAPAAAVVSPAPAAAALSTGGPAGTGAPAAPVSIDERVDVNKANEYIKYIKDNLYKYNEDNDIQDTINKYMTLLDNKITDESLIIKKQLNDLKYYITNTISNKSENEIKEYINFDFETITNTNIAGGARSSSRKLRRSRKH